MHVYDRLYGQIEFSDADLRLFQTEPMTRLRQISLSAVPPWLVPTGHCASRFEHSLGAAYLARKLKQKSSFDQIWRQVYFATLLHDVGSPPFSHASEIYLEHIYKKSHEAYVEDMISGSDLVAELKKQGGDIDLILKLITGTVPMFGSLVNGSIDLDNLDNSLRFSLSMGLFQDAQYDPEVLAEAYDVEGDSLVLRGNVLPELHGWELCRQETYHYVYSIENLAPATMLLRALDFAFDHGELDEAFFALNDSEAFIKLLTQSNSQTMKLMSDLAHWRHYQLAFSYETDTPSEAHQAAVKESIERKKLSDELATGLSIPSEDVSVLLRKDKGYKSIHLPIIDQDQSITYPVSSAPKWIVKVFIKADHTTPESEITNFLTTKGLI